MLLGIIQMSVNEFIGTWSLKSRRSWLLEISILRI